MFKGFIMKKLSIILCSLLLLVLFSGNTLAKEQYVGTPMPGFQDIPWRANEETIKDAMEDKGIKYDETRNSDGIKLVFFKGKYAGNDALYAFKLYNDEMWEALILAVDIPNYKIIGEWNNLKNLLIDKYGRPYKDFYFFQSPYYEGDGYETQAIRLGKGFASTYWKRPDGNGDNVILTCEITEDLALRVSYQHVELANIAINAARKDRSKGL